MTLPSSHSESAFRVLVTRSPTGRFFVNVTDKVGGEYASTSSTDLDTALLMAVPYMSNIAQPDLFGDALKRLISDDGIPPTAIGGIE